MALSIDADAQKCKWSLDGEEFAESVITNYLKQKSFVAYISMLHEKDTVKFTIEKEEANKD